MLADKVFIIEKGEYIVTKQILIENQQSENIQEIL